MESSPLEDARSRGASFPDDDLAAAMAKCGIGGVEEYEALTGFLDQGNSAEPGQWARPAAAAPVRTVPALDDEAPWWLRSQPRVRDLFDESWHPGDRRGSAVDADMLRWRPNDLGARRNHGFVHPNGLRAAAWPNDFSSYPQSRRRLVSGNGACRRGTCLRSNDVSQIGSNREELQQVRKISQYQDTSTLLEDYILYLAKDVTGWQVLLQKFYNGKPKELEGILNVVISRAAELMENPYGQHVLQQVLNGSGEEIRTKIVFSLTQDPTRFFRICMDRQGADQVLKMIQSLKTRQQFEWVRAALVPRLLDLMMDSNGLRIVQGCLTSFPSEMNKFIFDAVVMHCTKIACHQNGLSLLQSCLVRFRRNQRDDIIFVISSTSFHLAQNRYGNYIVQDVLNLEEPFSLATIASQLRGHYEELSTQKYSSNVVETCLKVFNDEERSAIIYELLSHPHFEHLVSDEYANYVISTALESCKGFLRGELASAILSLETVNRRHPHCLKIFGILSREGDARAKFS